MVRITRLRSDVGGVIDDGAGGDDYYASIIDTRVWEENAAKSSSLNSTAMVTPREVVPDHTSPAAQGALEETQRGEARRIGTPTQGSKGPTSRSGKSTEPRSSIIFEVREVLICHGKYYAEGNAKSHAFVILCFSGEEYSQAPEMGIGVHKVIAGLNMSVDLDNEKKLIPCSLPRLVQCASTCAILLVNIPLSICVVFATLPTSSTITIHPGRARWALR